MPDTRHEGETQSRFQGPWEISRYGRHWRISRPGFGIEMYRQTRELAEKARDEANASYRRRQREAASQELLAVAKMALAAARMELGEAPAPDFSPQQMRDAAAAAIEKAEGAHA